MKIKTSELKGAALDWAVAQAVGIEVCIRAESPCKVYDSGGVWLQPSARRPYMPSTDWAQGGPLIDSCKVALSPICNNGGYMAEWDMPTGGDDYDVFGVTAPTALVSACRAVVQKRLGFEIDVPEELT